MARAEPYILSQGLWTIEKIGAAARTMMSDEAWYYVSDVAEDGLAAAREREALDSILLRQRVMTEVGNIDPSVELFGQSLAVPVIASPTSGQGMVHREAELAVVRGCAAAGSIAAVSNASEKSASQIAAEGLPWWQQVYPQSDKGITLELIEHSIKLGASAIVLTVDVPVLGRRRNLPAGIAPPGWSSIDDLLEDVASDQNLRVMREPYTWADLGDFRERSSVPLLLKGVLDPEDATRARDAGVDGIVVSTHGGRQLDAAPSAVEVLPWIRDAVGDDFVLIADGSVRRGSHVLRLIARGANAVALGRPVLWGLACGGADGVRDVVEILKAEVITTMALTGCQCMQDVGADIQWPPKHRT